MADRTRMLECWSEDVDDSVEKLWLSLAREMFEIERFVLPSKGNGDKWAEFVRESLDNGRDFLLVAKCGDRLVGFAYASFARVFPFEVAEFVGVVNDVYVVPKLRGRGIGKKLMGECLNRLKAGGVNTVRLTVLTDNIVAVKLYEKLGFRIYRYRMIKV